MRTIVGLTCLSFVFACGGDPPPAARAMWQVRCGTQPGCSASSDPVDILASDGQDGNDVLCSLDPIEGRTNSVFTVQLRAADGQAIDISVLVADDGLIVGGERITVTAIVNGERNRTVSERYTLS